MVKKVLIFSLSYFPLVGGAEVAIKEITDRIYPEDDLQFDMVTFRFSKDHPKFEKIGHINVYRIGGGMGYLSKVFFVLQAPFFAIRRHYDLYWAMMTYMLFPVSLLRLSGSVVPYVLTLQDGDPFEHVFDRWYIKPFRPLLDYGFKHAHKVQTISRFLANWAKQMGYPGEVSVIPNGVNLEKFQNRLVQNKTKDTVTLITTSRLVDKNGVGYVISALKYLPDNVHFKIVGGGPLEQSLKMKVRMDKLESRVDFVGEVKPEKIPEILTQGDIFIRPSLSEGMGNSFIEAMAAGLPVIGTPVGGIPDFLKDGETGIFCQPHNPQSIVEAVNKIMSDQELRKRLVKNGLELSKQYDWNLIAEEMKLKVFRI